MNDAPITQADVALMRRVAKHDGPYFAEGYDLRRARKLREHGLVRGGHLGERYVQLTEEGREFLKKVGPG